nr:unnamed protein product [Callosobruchus chinensis]
MSEIQPPDLEKLSELSPSFSQKLLIVSLLLVFILSVIYHGRRWKWYYHSWNVPGPLAFPFIGSAYKLFGEPARTTMGVTMNVQTTKDFLGELPHRFSELFGRSNFMIRYQFKFIWDHSADKKVLARCAKMANDFSDSVVEKKLKEHEKKKQNGSYDHVVEDGSTIRRKAVLDLLIESSQMTETELKDEVITILAAATDTTANSSIYILLVLGLYPDVQQKVFEEVVEVMGSEKSVIPEHLLRMEYTERVIKEALRVLPVIALISRYASEDVEIGDYVAPAGTSISIPILYIHRCARYWKDPLKFDPDRFLPENVAKRHPLSYIPFSSGIRNCIGWRYAMMNLTTFTARVVREFKVFTQYKSLEEIQVEMHVFTKIKDGPKLWFETRT